jgi:hypothetical protein
MYLRYTVYRGGTPNASTRHYTVSAARSQYSQYCIKIHLDCIAVAVHFILWKKMSKFSVRFRWNCIEGTIRFSLWKILLKSRAGLPYSSIHRHFRLRRPKLFQETIIGHLSLVISDSPVKSLKMAETKNEDCRYQGLFKISSCSKKTFYGTIISEKTKAVKFT